MNQEEIRRQIRRNERAIHRARKTMEDIDRTLRESDERLERARVVLRRAGYLR
jgi:hypothetical protein